MGISNLFITVLLVTGLVSQSSNNRNEYSKNENLKNVFPAEHWLSIEPEKVGFSSEKLKIVRAKFENSGGIAMLIVVNGYIIGDWGETDRKIDSRSIRKSLINSIYGIYVEKGIINLNMRLSEIEINDKNTLTNGELETEIRYLLSSSSGIYLPAAFDERVNRSKPDRGIHEQGEHFIYNNWSFNVLSTIFNKLTDKDLFAAFDEHIAVPLQMENFDVRYDTYYLYQRELSNHPAYLFRISTKNLARYGLLYLNEGNWNGQQLIPKKWVVESTSPTVKTGKKFYYDFGYLWWVSKRGSANDKRPFLARGAQSQYMYIDSANDLIIIFRDNPEGTVEVKKSIAYPLIGLVYNAMAK